MNAHIIHGCSDDHETYGHDSHMTQFSAQVVDCFLHHGDRVIVLDQSAFYPGGGGQPHDTGAINAARVRAVSLAESVERRKHERPFSTTPPPIVGSTPRYRLLPRNYGFARYGGR